MTENTSKQPSPDGIVFAPLPKDKRFKDITGNRFTEWTILGYAGKSSGGARKRNMWWCKCSCGSVGKVSIQDLMSSTSRSCGCLSRRLTSARSKTHGMSQTKEYLAWKNMISRCGNIKNKSYADYGGRGVSVSSQWLGECGFVNFYSQVGPRPSDVHSLGRIDNDGNYEPGNVRWESDFQQSCNKRNNILVEYDGNIITASHCSRITGVSARVLRKLKKRGVDPDKCYEIATRGATLKHYITALGKTMTIREWSLETGLKWDTLYFRKKRGWPDELIVSTGLLIDRSNKLSQTPCTDQPASRPHQTCHE